MFKIEAIINLLMFLFPLALALLAGLFMPLALSSPVGFLILTIGSFILGLSLFFIAKWTNFKKGILFSFGSSGMDKQQKNLYWFGYGFIFVGFFAIIILLASLKLYP